MKRNIIIAFLAIVALSFSACKEKGLDTNQYGDKVSLNAFGPCPVLRGDTIIVIGSHMDKVSQVIFPVANEDVPGYEAIEKSKFIASSKPAEEFYIKVPENAISSKIALVADKDTIWSSTIVSYVEPVEVTGIKPGTPVTAGDIITIEGEFMWNITSITFYGGVTVEAANFVKVGRKYIQVQVPVYAISGMVTLLAGEDEFEAGVLEIHTPIINKTGATMNVEYGDEIIITGEYLQFITTVNYPGVPNVDFKLNDDGTAITTNVPMSSLGGVITLVNDSTSATFSTDTIAVPLVVVDSLSGKVEDLYPGDLITIHGKLFDRVEYILLPSGEILKNIKFVQQQYEVNEDGTIITFTVREGQGDGGVILFQHDNNQPKTAGLSMHKDGNIIYGFATPWDVESWGHNLELFTDKNPDVYAAVQGAIHGPGKLTLNVETYENAGGYYQLKFQWLDWSTVIDCDPGVDYKALELGQKSVTINVKDVDVEALNSMGWVIYGNGVKINSIEWEGEGDAKLIYEGPFVAEGWGNQPMIGADGGTEFIQMGVKVGQTLIFYVEKTKDDWAFDIIEGHWGPTYAGYCNPNKEDTEGRTPYDLEANGGIVTLEITQEIYDAALTQQWWGGTFLINGDGVIITKVMLQ